MAQPVDDPSRRVTSIALRDTALHVSVRNIDITRFPLVSIVFDAFDSKNAPIADLDKGDIVISENGRQQDIINLSSIEGLIGDPNLAAYNASKGGVRLLTKSAALDFAQRGYKVRVNSIHPGYIRTPMVEGYVGVQADPSEAERRLVALHPVGHLGEPDDIAYGVVYLASEESKFVTGAELVIDGGYTAQ